MSKNLVYIKENNNQINLIKEQNLKAIIFILKIFFHSYEDSNFEPLNEQEEKYNHEEKDMIKELDTIELIQNENTNNEGKSMLNKSTESTEKEKQTNSKKKLKRKKKVNSKRKVLRRCLIRRIKLRKKRIITPSKNTNNINKIDIEKKDNNPNEEQSLNSQIGYEHKNVKDISKIREEDKKLEDLKKDKKVKNNPNDNKQNDNKYDAMSVSSLDKNDNIQNDNQNEENIINPNINNNADNLSISSEQNQINQNNSSQHGMSEDNSLNDSNSKVNQNQGVFFYQDNQENNEGDEQVPYDEMTYVQTYENDSFNNQGFGLNVGSNTILDLFENNDDFSMIDYLNHYDNENDEENQLNSEGVEDLRNLESNNERKK